MSADTTLMPIPGADRSRARAARRDAARRRPGRARRPVEGPDPRRARSRRARAQAGQAARQADLALDLQSRGQRLRGDERHRQGAAAAGSPSASSSRGPKWSRRRFRPTARANGCCKTHDGHDFEMVFIPDADRGTLVRVEPGRLHAQLPLLPHRHDAAGAQPRAGGDRRPGDARPRRARRMAVASPKGGC